MEMSVSRRTSKRADSKLLVKLRATLAFKARQSTLQSKRVGLWTSTVKENYRLQNPLESSVTFGKRVVALQMLIRLCQYRIVSIRTRQGRVAKGWRMHPHPLPGRSTSPQRAHMADMPKPPNSKARSHSFPFEPQA
jgi:hypothetical protein